MSKTLHELAKDGNTKEIQKLFKKAKPLPNPNQDDGVCLLFLLCLLYVIGWENHRKDGCFMHLGAL